MNTNIEKMMVEINLRENAAYVVIDGHLTTISPKEHGEDVVIWKDGKVLDVIRSERYRLQGQEII